MNSPSRLSKRLEGVSESATLKLNALVQALKKAGIPVVNLTAGEPDFFVPEPAKDAAIEAIRANRSKYTPVPGIPELRTLIAERTNLQQPSLARITPWKPENVVVTNGGKQALFNAFLSLLNPGDEVLIPAPYWLSYPEMVKLAGGVPRVIATSIQQGFKISSQQLKESLSPKVKAVIFNSPSNPTGALYSREEYAAIGNVLLNHPGAEDVWVVSDEIYDRITFAEEGFWSFLQCVPELHDRTVTINGMSKSMAMTGWRVGWSVAPEDITQAMMTIQGQSTSGINAPAQWASVAALKLSEGTFAYQVESFRQRRDKALEILKKAGKMEVRSPEGAFYFFVGIGAYLQKGETADDFAEKLLKKANVAVMSGVPFGAPNFVRLSFAVDPVSLQDGCERIVEFLGRL